ncbi:MAG: cofactor-independent phosphoglycerate mutase [Myxococcota bacterium]
MKYIVILGDGMADWKIDKLGGKTPLQVAKHPAIDALAKKGRLGTFRTVDEDLPPGSEVANLSVLGYDPRKYNQGRGVLEAASMGVELEPDNVAMRANLICIEDGKIKNHSAGHISNQESHPLIEFLCERLCDDETKLYPGVSYRHLLTLKSGSPALDLAPPHDYIGKPFREILPKATSKEGEKTAKKLERLILKSQELLSEHPINRRRISDGKDPANSLWFWSAGKKPAMPTYQEQFGVRGAVISAVDLIQGLGKYAGMEIIKVEGATGLYDTNYEGKADAALKALNEYDFVFVHVEASDEAGHEGNVELKVKTIEYLDSRLVKRIVEGVERRGIEATIAVLPDHITPCATRGHVHGEVPVLIYDPRKEPDGVDRYDEDSAKQGALGLLTGDMFIKTLLGRG